MNRTLVKDIRDEESDASQVSGQILVFKEK
jgi:hypothetical protein